MSRIDDLDERLRVVEERLAALTRPGGAEPPTTEEQTDSLWVLRGLERRLAGGEAEGSGAVLFAGSWDRPETAGTPGRVNWQYGLPVEAVLGWDWAELAPVLSALGHPVRLTLLQQVLTGTTETAALETSEGLGTSGQLHHHLRALVSAGWLRSPRRGRYEVPGPRVIPLLALLLAGHRD